MQTDKVHLAIDLGGGSGRVLAGEYDGGQLALHELHRFDNQPVRLPDGWHWNPASLFTEILRGLRIASDRFGERAVTLGIDTWGVDYGLFDTSGRLLGLPYQYRDQRTDGMMDKAFAKVPSETIYEATGIQFIFFNTVFQLLAEAETESGALTAAEDLLFTPDLLGYWLTGEMTQERTIASTSQLYNPRTRDWDRELIDQLGLPGRLFKHLSDPGTPLGALRPELAENTALGDLRVVSVAGHDTASAVAAVPATEGAPAFLSSGTWSLMGFELPEPVINRQSFADNFTNEIGVGGTVRFLKNLCGLWLIQECRRHWSEAGQDYDYAEMAGLAEKAEPFRSLIDPDDPRFVQPGDMPARIAAYCRETGQPEPSAPGEFVRCIYESLALRYAEVWQALLRYCETPPEALHVVGGGCRDAMLNQFTADALGVPVLAGPVEATGLGNIIVQMLAEGTLGSHAEGRALLAASFPPECHTPSDTARDQWRAAAERFTALPDRASDT